MNFWKTLRRVGQIVLAVLAVIALLATVLRHPDAGENPFGALTGTHHAPRNKSADHTGL